MASRSFDDSTVWSHSFRREGALALTGPARRALSSPHAPRVAPRGDSRRASFMVIRVWMEPGEGSLRGRIVRAPDGSGEEQDLLAVGAPEAVYEAVRDWLEGFLTERS